MSGVIETNEEELFRKGDIIESSDEIDDENEDEDTDTIDPEYIAYLQNSFQDKVVDDIFVNIVSYVGKTAIPICEYLTRDDIEVIIQELGGLN
jgi:hypothetical protein